MTLLIFVFLVVLIAGVPVFIALAGSSLIYTHFLAGIPDFVILHRMAGGIDSFPLLAVPFFILAGNLMNSAGITNRIYDFAVAMAGWMRGGLAHVNIIGSVIFSGMSGTAIAAAAGLGTLAITALSDHGYDTEFSVGMTFGWFTPTEAAIAACAWALILGTFLYRSLTLKQFYKVTLDTIETTAGVLLVVGAASLFGWVLTTTRLTEQATEALLSITD